jgi:hypothetical protein
MPRRYRASGFETAGSWGMIRSASAHKGDDVTAARSKRDNARRIAVGILAYHRRR